MPFISKVPYFGGVFFFFLFYRTPAFPQNNCWCNYQGTGMFSSDHMLCTLWSSWLVCQLSGRSSAFKFSFHCFSSFLSLSLCFPKAPVSFGDSYSSLSLPDRSCSFIMFVRVTFIILEGGQDHCSKSFYFQQKISFVWLKEVYYVLPVF